MTDWTRSPFEPDIARVRRIPGVEAMLREVCALTGMGFTAVARVTDTHWVACQVLDKIGFGLEVGGELDLKTTICDEIRQSGCHVIIDHVTADPDWRTHHTPALYGFESYISIPIMRLDGFYGTLCSIDPEPCSVKLATIVPRMQEMAAEIAAALDAEEAQARGLQVTTL
ncbi:GAF domain-containing protein [Sphingomonas sp. MG17]|uniref:GAF domain-containing protein n=1 Tax=Sphingomonas tagetis TaxID=2949092 RepID=A0A9X2HEI9_9SPHN|nr:GAF domain-containing protein [Sphingomonas tagetis]MCP3729631.1 GAF domain-containing protein [Sphingomonas tagetis]